MPLSALLVLQFVVLFTSVFLSSNAESVTFSNLNPRLDNTGQIMDAHDGNVIKYNGLYYLFSAAYGLCKEPLGYGCDQTADHCGFRNDHNISVYVSTNMASGSWLYVGLAITLDKRPQGILYRPHIVFNPNTNLFVLYWNYNARLAVATSPSPTQPFVLQRAEVNVSRDPEYTGDYYLMVDDDGSCYIIYSANFSISIEKLSKDYLDGTGQVSALFPDYFVEAPVMFKRNNLYYSLFGHCCCFCEQGSGVYVYIAKNPLGPWKLQPGGDLACMNSSVYKNPLTEQSFSSKSLKRLKGIPTPGQGCLYTNSNSFSITRSQQNSVVIVNTSSGVVYIWTGDRWQQAPDGIKGHEPQYWFPLKFDNQGFIQKITWVDQFSLDLV